MKWFDINLMVADGDLEDSNNSSNELHKGWYAIIQKTKEIWYYKG